MSYRERYFRNLMCRCGRCRRANSAGSALLAAIGLQLLLHTSGVLRIAESWPAILIVIGLGRLYAHRGSTEGHVQPWWCFRRYSVATSAPHAGTP